MKRYFSIPLLALMALMFNQGVLAEPSRFFSQETALMEAAGSVSLDLEYPFSADGVSTGLRAGALGGVVLVNSHSEMGTRMGFAASNVGFKKLFQEEMAVYGVLSYYDNGAASGTNFALGMAYTGKSGTLTFNLNPELITDKLDGNRGLNNTIFLKGAMMMPLTAVKTGKASVIVEVAIEDNNALDSIANLGLRWAPRPDITLDFIVYSDRGSPAINGGAKDVEKGIPGWIKLNIQL